MKTARRVRFCFDYISNNAYLAWVALVRMAERDGFVLVPEPVLFAGLLNSTGQLGPAEIPAKSRWMWRNTLRKAAILDVPLHPPIHHPFRPLLSLRASLVPMTDQQRTALVTALFEAVWVESLHVSESEVVASVANRIGLDGAALVAAADQPEIKDRLRRATDDAIAEGVFGVPTMIVDGELFWGYDDLPYLEAFLAGEDPLDPSQLPTRESGPKPSARRPRP
ncbi:MAG: 2-hydroxychromene-2-carboxylate isomerase [Hyphomicrobiaceae bacterium]|jgi:2-hydroxychromene-2-carboxylate isomerase